MGELWQILRDNPIVVFFLVAWIAGAIGNAVRGQKKAQQRAAPSRPARPEKPTQAPWPVDRRSAPPAPKPEPRGGRSPDEIAAEMRRILGLDVEIQPVAPRQQAPVQRAPRREPVEPERAPAPVEPSMARRALALHTEPNVGEQMASRKGPRSGYVGSHDREWGTLGGRRRDVVVEVTRVDPLVDLRDLKRIILGAEILGPPLALRDPDQRMF